ncbi:TonB family protein [Sulfurimonas sp.]|uniref:energy transducer TonB n=1 Tax=Sulfurimonas sp. TaxID=2022749 RepID=UPI003D0BA88E
MAAAIFFSYKAIAAYSNNEQHLCACCTTTINLSTVKIEKPVVKPQKEIVKTVEQVKKPVQKKIKEPIVTPKVTKQKSVEKKEVIEQKVVVQKEEINTTKPVVQNIVQKDDVDTECETEVIVQKSPEELSDKYLSLHVSEIVALLKENFYYPRRARKQGIEGVVTVKFTLSKDAKISNIEVLDSKYEILSNAAVETIQSLEDKLPKPDEELTLTIPIDYSLK